MSQKQFAHLHVHTDYSALDGASKIDTLVDEVVRLGQPGVAITDHGNAQGAYELWKNATDAGITPVIGQEFYVAPGGSSRHGRERIFFGDTRGEDKIERSNDVSGGGAYTHMTMWAETTEGMHNLFKMSSYAFLEGRFGMNHAPRIDDELIAQYGKGIIATTGCPSGEIQTRIRLGQWDKAVEYAAKMQDILGKDNYFVELMDHDLHIEKIVREDLLKLSKHMNIPLVATNDTHYTRREDSANHDHLLCIQTGSKIDSENRFRFNGDGYYIKSAEEMRQLFSNHPDACDNTLEIVERCNVEFAEGIDLMPKSEVPEGMTDGEFLEAEVIRLLPERVRGWDKLDEEKKEEYYKQGKYECSIINQMGFPSYFLVVGDFVQWAKDQGIAVGPGRGCLAPDSQILTPHGFKNIQDIKVGDTVYDQNGQQVEVPQVFEYDCDEDLIKVSVSEGHSNSMTADHKILVRKVGKPSPLWYRADEVSVGDEVVMPSLGHVYSSPVAISDRDPDYAYYRVMKTETVKNPSQKVYDFTVPTTNSYVTDSYVVHNSAGGCLVAYAMSITDIDPIKHGLIFERFLNPERVSMPDIDIDFDDKRRGEVIAYVTEKYGEDKVAQIVTFGLIKAKAALKDASRILDNPYGVGDILSKKMPDMAMGRTMTLSGVYDPEDARYPEAQEFRDTVDEGAGNFSSETFKEVVEVARGLEGYLRQTGIHAAGVIMSSQPLIETIPLMLPKPKALSKKKKEEKEGKKEEDALGDVITSVTQFDYPTCETLGLLKMDFLGLRNLTIITDAFGYIKENHGIDITLEDLIHSELDDKKTYKLLQRGDTLGIFQLDGSGMRSLLRSLRPTEFNDISAVLALYRPGPMGVNAHMDYADRKNNRKPTHPIHSELDEPLHEILGETHQLVVFQEQIMQIAQKVAGYSLGEADLLRRAMGKKKKEEMDKQSAVFSGGMKKRGYSTDAFDALWSVLLPFADYAFNKSHSAGYALLSYVTAYLKAHYPSEYMAALLTSVGDKPDQTALYLNECRRMGIDVLPPDIRKSKRNYDPKDKSIVFGLGSIRGLGEGTVEGIIDNRNDGSYDSLEELLNTFPSDALNKKVFDGLIHSGSLDHYGYSRRALEKDLILSLPAAKTVREEKDEGSMSLFDAYEVEMPPVAINDITEYTKKEKLAFERRMLGLYVSDHPLSNMEDVLEREAEKSIADIQAGHFNEGDTTKIAGVITHVENKTTKKGDPMQIATVEDMSSEMSVLVFGGTIKENGYLLRDNIYRVVGQLRQREDEDVTLMVRSFSEIEVDEATGKVPFWLKFQSTQLTQSSLRELQKVLMRYPGDTPVRMSIKEPYGKITNMSVGEGILVRPSPGLAQLIMGLFGPRSFGKWNE